MFRIKAILLGCAGKDHLWLLRGSRQRREQPKVASPLAMLLRDRMQQRSLQRIFAINICCDRFCGNYRQRSCEQQPAEVRKASLRRPKAAARAVIKNRDIVATNVLCECSRPPRGTRGLLEVTRISRSKTANRGGYRLKRPSPCRLAGSKPHNKKSSGRGRPEHLSNLMVRTKSRAGNYSAISHHTGIDHMSSSAARGLDALS